MKKFFSYFFPVTKKISTEFNGIVELTYYNGRKMLNSEHANYSYDSLQRLLKFGLTKIDVSKVDTILLLGLGGGSVIKTLTNDFDFKGKITALELDKTIIDIAENEFQIAPGTQLEIINGDALEFVKNAGQEFDLIIIDLFIDNKVPDIFYSEIFWKPVSILIKKQGCFIFNASVTNASAALLTPMLQSTQNAFNIERFDHVEA